MKFSTVYKGFKIPNYQNARDFELLRKVYLPKGKDDKSTI